MDLIQAIVYGIVQGLTEWLPVSSTAHLRIVPALFGWNDPGAGFTAVIQLGTLAAVLIYFWSDIVRVIGAWFKSLTGKLDKSDPDAQQGWGVFWGTIPIVVLGVIFSKHIKGELRSLWVVAISLIVVGLILLIAEAMGKRNRSLKDLTTRDGIMIGLCQAVALIPGASRSGSTLSGAFFLNFDRTAAARFSFLLSIPSVFAAGIKEVFDERHHLFAANLMPSLVATVVSFIVGYATIAWFINYLQRGSTKVFVAYRILLGVGIIALLLSHRLVA